MDVGTTVDKPHPHLISIDAFASPILDIAALCLSLWLAAK